MKRLTVGVHYTPAPGEPIADTVRAAREIEAMGYRSLALPDHLTRPHAAAIAPVPDPLLLLARLAADTTHLTLATMTLLDAFRAPEQTLRSAATLQHITGGRLELGVGAGWQNADLNALPTGLRAASARIDALERTLDLLRQAWPLADRPNQPDAARAWLLAAEAAPPQLIIAAGSTRMLHLAARYADTIALTVPTRPRLAGAVPTAQSVAAQIATVRAARPGHLPPPGFHLQIREITPRASHSGDDTWWTVGGSPARIAEALQRRADAGITDIALCTEDLQLLEWTAVHVLPQLEQV
ncbi:LLM class flavin-dependent oxidoreductase [Kitasatospora sp. NPDC092286]|uniref:LLM class flavin-dependent oxidoreductase n=1 Tax=Kitasatospora sp. NPDC092286 TaxID=3364087 RepID=UPI0037F64856